MSAKCKVCGMPIYSEGQCYGVVHPPGSGLWVCEEDSCRSAVGLSMLKKRKPVLDKKDEREFFVTVSQTYRVSANDSTKAAEKAMVHKQGLVLVSTEIEEVGADIETKAGECAFMDRYTRHCEHPAIAAMRWLELNAVSVYIDAEEGGPNRNKTIWYRNCGEMLRDAVLAEKEKQLRDSPWRSSGEGYREEISHSRS